MNKFLTGLSDRILKVLDWKVCLDSGLPMTLQKMAVYRWPLVYSAHVISVNREAIPYITANKAFVDGF